GRALVSGFHLCQGGKKRYQLDRVKWGYRHWLEWLPPVRVYSMRIFLFCLNWGESLDLLTVEDNSREDFRLIQLGAPQKTENKAR
ncbi:hypothetical protein ACTG28_21645, partial [Aeromonas caviae]|uniref:hypothetical protein n=1 Tax=Aeromonas caviae TaxID=648 RepID=UPI003F79AB17